MAGETVITVIGNLTGDPELRFTPSGAAVANFTIASTPRNFDRQSNEWKDGETLFLRCSIWREAAESVAESLTKGTRVIATGVCGERPAATSALATSPHMLTPDSSTSVRSSAASLAGSALSNFGVG